MEPDKQIETAQFASKLYQAVQSLKPNVVSGTRQVHRMGRALALAELQRARERAGDSRPV